MGLAGTLALLAATVAILFGVALTRDDEAPTALDEAAPPLKPPPCSTPMSSSI